jgi:hypothetical protein
MKIKSETMINFLRRLSLNGKIADCVLNFGENGLSSRVMSINVAYVEDSLDKKEFSDYAPIGEVGIKNNRMLISMLERYSDKTVMLELKENKLVIVSETGSTFYTLCEKSNIDNHTEESMEKVISELPQSFEVDVSRLSSIKKAAKTLGTSQVFIDIKDNMMKLTAESESGDKITEEVAVKYNNVSCKYGELLLDVIDVISDKVAVSLKTDFPVVIKDKRAIFLIAPIVQKDE